MLMKLKKMYEEFDYYELNNIIFIICFLIFIISLYFLNNVFLIIFLYLLVFYHATYLNDNLIKFITTILPLMIIGFLVTYFFKLTFIELDIFKYFFIIIKVFFCVDYLLIVFNFLKKKKNYILRDLKKLWRYYSFKELRKRNYNDFKEKNKDLMAEYINENNINLSSDYYKVIEDNFENKSLEDLEEYVWINYLRFFKNRRNIKKIKFEKYNLVFLGIHVIIFLLVILVR